MGTAGSGWTWGALRRPRPCRPGRDGTLAGGPGQPWPTTASALRSLERSLGWRHTAILQPEPPGLGPEAAPRSLRPGSAGTIGWPSRGTGGEERVGAPRPPPCSGRTWRGERRIARRSPRSAGPGSPAARAGGGGRQRGQQAGRPCAPPGPFTATRTDRGPGIRGGRRSKAARSCRGPSPSASRRWRLRHRKACATGADRAAPGTPRPAGRRRRRGPRVGVCPPERRADGNVAATAPLRRGQDESSGLPAPASQGLADTP